MEGVAELWKDCRTYVIPNALLSDNYSTDLPPEDESDFENSSEAEQEPEPGEVICEPDDPTPRAYRYPANERPLIFHKKKDPYSPIYDRNDARPWFGLSCSERPACSDSDTELELEAESQQPVLTVTRLPQPPRGIQAGRRRRPSMPSNGSALGYTSYLPLSNLSAKRARNSGDGMQNSVFATKTVRKLIIGDASTGTQVASQEEHACVSTAVNERENPAMWWLSLAAVSGMCPQAAMATGAKIGGIGLKIGGIAGVPWASAAIVGVGSAIALNFWFSHSTEDEYILNQRGALFRDMVMKVSSVFVLVDACCLGAVVASGVTTPVAMWLLTGVIGGLPLSFLISKVAENRSFRTAFMCDLLANGGVVVWLAAGPTVIMASPAGASATAAALVLRGTWTTLSAGMVLTVVTTLVSMLYKSNPGKAPLMSEP